MFEKMNPATGMRLLIRKGSWTVPCALVLKLQSQGTRVPDISTIRCCVSIKVMDSAVVVMR